MQVLSVELMLAMVRQCARKLEITLSGGGELVLLIVFSAHSRVLQFSDTRGTGEGISSADFRILSVLKKWVALLPAIMQTCITS